ncbi:endoribonuclease SymE [Pseudescherichia sp.]|uniref:endoribonuclease SymE n=1 Tax=Pseudescherichia sp. TaxID=2055881 RepID=UPI0028AAC16B|nr:endoribonuclease SymE [Pseudescherichia sp.]
MADENCLVESVTQRRLTVSYATRFHDRAHVPAITIKGQWLAEAGFPTGTEMDVRILNGCIVLIAKPVEEELIQTVRKISTLSARKQRQVQDYIDLVAAKRRVN